MGSTTLAAVRLRTEYRTNPLGIDIRQPRLSWQIAASGSDVLQRAYQIQVSTEDKTLWDTGQVGSAESIHVIYQGAALRSGQRCQWQVRVWDQNEQVSEWSQPAWWEMGLLDPGDWQASWIDPEGQSDAQAFKPCPYLRKTFVLGNLPIQKARAYITCHGLYELWINGQRVGDQVLTPGFTSYHKRLQYQVYDVTELLNPGENCVGAILGDGWWRGKTSGLSLRNVYGTRLALLAQIHILHADGSQEWVVSDETWKTSRGPILKSDMKDGEIYDARLEMPGWDRPGYADQQWNAVQVADFGFENLVASNGPEIRRHETFIPTILKNPRGEIVLDFGQNIAGWVTFRVSGPSGTTIRLTHGETLDKDGNFTMSNFNPGKVVATLFNYQDLVQQVEYTLKGGGVEEYEPRFCFQGFRYVKVENYPGELQPENFAATAIYSDMHPTGTFECSHSLVNQLHHNIEWSLKGNFLDIPTDCPHRERAGYTGDAQVFARTGSFIMETAGFFHKWLLDLREDQHETGMVPIIVPDPTTLAKSGSMAATNGSAGWGDAVTIIPWAMYQVFADRRILEDLYPAMKAWVGYIKAHAEKSHWSQKLKPSHLGGLPDYHRYLWDTDFHFGEWSEPGSNYAIDLLYSFILPRPAVATAFYAHSAELTAKAAGVLGKTDESREYHELAENVKAAWVREYVQDDGRIQPDNQASYVRALAFELLPEEKRAQAAERLAGQIEANGYHIGTGFLATPFICHVLAQYGYLDTAYRLLLQVERPSWLYPVTRGATTIWEFWDAVKEDGSMKMSSHNHYSPGSIGSWLYQVVAGIELGAPGYKHINIQPQPGGGLTEARAAYESLYGEIASAWQITPNQFRLSVTLPPNTTGTIRFPAKAGGGEANVGSGTHEFNKPWSE